MLMERTIFTEMGKGAFQEIDEKYVNSEFNQIKTVNF